MALLLVGVVTTLFTVLVHSLIPPMILMGVRRQLERGRAGIWFWDAILVMNFTLLALAAHVVEIALWALSLVLCGEFSNFAAALYYSGNTYTTLGDSTTVLSARWRMLGPIEAADGMLMFGVSTAIIFAVIHRLIDAKFGLQRDPPPKTG
jgi:voltage-gated potassium channel Kch